MFAKILAMAVILASPSAFAADVNYEDPNLAYNSSDTSAENSVCIMDGKGNTSLQKCLVAQGMRDLEHVGASVSYTQRILDSDSKPTPNSALGGSRRPAEATHFKLKKKRSRKH